MLLLTLVYCFFSILSLEGPTHTRIEPALWRRLASGDTVDCVVVFQEQAQLSTLPVGSSKQEKGRYVFAQLQKQQAVQAPLRDFLVRQGVDYETLFIVNALRLKADRQLVHQIAQRREVARVVSNPTIRLPRAEQAARHIGLRSNQVEWNLSDIGADQVWAMGYRGQGVVVGGQDTGFEWTHPALMQQYRGNQGDTINHNYNWYDAIHEYNPLNGTPTNPCGLDLVAPCDDNVHGTHTMGIMVGADTAGNAIGVAPEAQWVGVRNMERGYGNPFSYLEAFQWFLAPTDVNGEGPNPDLAPHVINNSWYCPELEGCNESNIGLLEMAVQHLRAAGIVVVASAGNSGSGCGSITELPAIFPASFAVGATDINQQIAPFSSRGPVYGTDSVLLVKPDVTAPGVLIRSAGLNGGFVRLSGTSMAGPHVAGTVALMISANPALAGQVDTIETILRRTARPRLAAQDCTPLLGEQHPNAVFGYGIIDARAAVEAALTQVISSTTRPDSARPVQVYPNPSSGRIWMHRAVNDVPLEVRLLNSQGQIVGQKRWSSGTSILRWELDVPAGLYWLHYQAGQQQYTNKLVIQ